MILKHQNGRRLIAPLQRVFGMFFAVFFPAVTGFTAGIGMSGDLKNPQKSIPIGTMGAVVSGVIIYLIIPLLLSVTAALTIEELADPNEGLATWTKVAFLGSILVYPAVWGAILSSAFGSILGGPRVLQALSMDGLAPKFLSKLSKSGQPTTATWISGIIALFAVSLGELNTVAKFVSVLFLTLYIAINLSAAIEQLVAEPSYRPKIKVPWYVSLTGAAGAIAVMYLISPIACFVALFLELALFIWLRSRSLEQLWGDVAAGFWMNISRYAMLQLSKRKIHPRNWRPLVLLFVKDIEKRLQLVKLAEALGCNHGVLTISKLLISKEVVPMEQRRDLELEMSKELEKNRMEAFCEVNVVEELHNGILDISKAHGLAGLKTNTIIFGWSEESNGQIQQLKIIRDLAQSGKNILLVRFTEEALPENCKKIDIWWGGKESNGDLMLLLAHLLQLNRQWETAQITIRSVVENNDEKIRLTKGVKKLLTKARISAEVEILIRTGLFRNVLHKKSRDADLVFLGLTTPAPGQEEKVITSIEQLSAGLKATVFVQNNGMPETMPILLNLE